MPANKNRTEITKSPRPNYSAPALEKGLDILELMGEQTTGLSQGDIAKALNRSVSEIFRMLSCLVERGYVTLHRPADLYTLSLKMFELSHRHPPMRRLISEALPLMKDIARTISQSCHLTVINNDRILVVGQVDSPGELGFFVRMGTQLDLLQTASGIVMLAFQSDQERERMIRAYQTATGTKPGRKNLEKQCAIIRERGYEEANSQQVASVRNISLPVLDYSGHAFAAITVPFLRRVDRDSPELIVKARTLLRDAASKLSSVIDTLAR